MEPQLWFCLVTYLPGIPGAVRLCFTCHQSPAIGANAILFKQGKNLLERITKRSCHEFGANHWTTVAFYIFDAVLHALLVFVAVETNDIRMAEHVVVKSSDLGVTAPVILPWGHRNR